MSSHIKLRPHHLLCTQTYSGKGYSRDFVENMDCITSRLRLASETIIEIVTSTDDICAKCPLVTEAGICVTNEKVQRMDSKVMSHFGVCEKTYAYRDIMREIGKKINASIVEDICGECDWYSICQGILPCK